MTDGPNLPRPTNRPDRFLRRADLRLPTDEERRLSELVYDIEKLRVSQSLTDPPIEYTPEMILTGFLASVGIYATTYGDRGLTDCVRSAARMAVRGLNGEGYEIVRKPSSARTRLYDFGGIAPERLEELLEEKCRDYDALVDLLAEVVEHLTVDDDECVHVLWEPEPGNQDPTAPALPDDLWCRIRKVVES